MIFGYLLGRRHSASSSSGGVADFVGWVIVLVLLVYVLRIVLVAAALVLLVRAAVTIARWAAVHSRR